MNRDKPSDNRLSGLYVITDHDKKSTAQLLMDVRQCLENGASLVQYRDKSADTDKRRQQAQALKQLCDEFNRPLIINDDVELAVYCQADGVHLGKQDAGLVAARKQLGDNAIIGVSCYNRLSLAIQSEPLADYVAFGRFFPSKSKPDAARASIDLLKQANAKIQRPIVAIGGITPDNAATLIKAGADMIAVIQAVFGHPAPGTATKNFLSSFQS